MVRNDQRVMKYCRTANTGADSKLMEKLWAKCVSVYEMKVEEGTGRELRPKRNSENMLNM